ncbi:MAG: YbhB/YbcL family Raf kinase inhibitor-like protein [Sediminibacterium sp.]
MKSISIILFVFVGFLSCSKSTTTNNNNNTINQAPTTIAKQLVFTGNGFANNGIYPKVYTCDSSGFAPGLQWSNAPSGTNSYAITMHHFPPTYPTEDKHVYIVLYNIPSTVTNLPENAKTIGSFGINTVDRKNTYTPPCSQGPGAKVYILTLYALSATPSITVSSSQVTMDVLLAGIRNKILDSSVMTVTYTR